MYPTPYRWTTDDGLTHVFYNNHMPPSTGFGWSSLCDEVRLPIEGEHFKLDEDVTAEDITCRHCQDRLDRPYVALNDDSMVGVNGCLVRVERDEGGEITWAERVCSEALHNSLSFELDSFSENLEKQVEAVCSECWETYVERQWSSDVEGAELRVEVWGDDGRSKYFAAGAEAIRGGPEGVLRVVSENGLEKDIRREEIESITLTPAQRVDY